MLIILIIHYYLSKAFYLFCSFYFFLVVEPGRKAWKKLKKEFGDEIFHPDGTLNRVKLGEIIFANTEKRKRLNLITHPEIIKEMVIAAVKVGLRGKHKFILCECHLWLRLIFF